jgi:hypothetical protein
MIYQKNIVATCQEMQNKIAARPSRSTARSHRTGVPTGLGEGSPAFFVLGHPRTCMENQRAALPSAHRLRVNRVPLFRV